MASETVADILREMRECAIGAATEIVGIADRIEAAHEPKGNAAKMREALSVIIDACDTILKMKHDPDFVEKWAVSTRNVAARALAAPPRNCDVGTAEEQYRRWRIFCDSTDCRDCPCPGEYEPSAVCFCHWSQLPYKEGGAE